MSIADVLIEVNGATPREAASRFSAAGLPLFPCEPGGKRPLTRAGFLDATQDTDRVTAWWRRWPTANLGMPTGIASGIEVVDVDVKTDGSGYFAFDRAAEQGLLDGEIARVRTPSGGMHVYFPSAADRRQRSWQAARAHIDFRGEGGYVIVPPSAAPSSTGPKAYRAASLSAARSRPIDSNALREFVDPRPAPLKSAGARVISGEALSQWVARLNEGERNHGLFWAACRLSEAGIQPDAIVDVLGPPATRIGLDPQEIERTVRSACRHCASSRSRAAPPGPEHARPRTSATRSMA